VVGFVFSHTQPADPGDPSVKENHALIVEYGGTPFLGAMPYLGPRDELTGEALGDAVREHLDLSPLLKIAR